MILKQILVLLQGYFSKRFRSRCDGYYLDISLAMAASGGAYVPTIFVGMYAPLVRLKPARQAPVSYWIIEAQTGWITRWKDLPEGECNQRPNYRRSGLLIGFCSRSRISMALKLGV